MNNIDSSTILKSQDIWILADPVSAIDVEPGKYYKTDFNDHRTIHIKGSIGGIIEPRNGTANQNFKLPEIKPGPIVTSNEMGKIKSEDNLNLGISFFKGLFSLISNKLGFDLSAKITANNIEEIFYRIDERYSEGFLTGDLENALRPFDVRQDIKIGDSDGDKYYVCYKVHYCKKITLFFGNLNANEIQVLANLPTIADFNLVFNDKKEEGKFLVIESKGPIGIPFGVSLARIFYYLDGSPIKIEHTTTTEDIKRVFLLPPKKELTNFQDTPYVIIKKERDKERKNI